MADPHEPTSTAATPDRASASGRSGDASASNAIIIDEACARVVALADPREKELALAFTRVMFAKAPREFFNERNLEELASIALQSFRFVDAKGKADVHVEVVDPDQAGNGWHSPVTVIRTNVTERSFIVDTIRELLHDRELAIER